jgi:hypothetical protein
VAAQHVALANRPHGAIQLKYGLRRDHGADCLVRIADRLQADRQRRAEI